jgi:hypothetical protein
MTSGVYKQRRKEGSDMRVLWAWLEEKGELVHGLVKMFSEKLRKKHTCNGSGPVHTTL